MSDHHFLNLSPREFENLSRDLLQKELGVVLESFSEGRDGGIDFRYWYDNRNSLVIQCKRYKDYPSLFRDLKKEVRKVVEINPDRYIVTTSVSLNKDQKAAIKKLFSPYILSPSDIYGRDDLNNRLGLYPEVEESCVKLWLPSIEALKRVQNSEILVHSSLAREDIEATVKTYVQNESFDQALAILKDRKYVIVSGIPGIGKTTLVRMLAFFFLKKGFDDFYAISSSIDEAYRVFNEKRAQLFVFDDFLGRSFSENRLRNNEETELVRFIKKIQAQDNKVFILATREYILAQAKAEFEVLDSPLVDFAKCVIDLSQYTRQVRAEILYNHLFFSNVSERHIQDIVRDENYFRIIDHRNYNPRIIETILSDDIWKTIKPNEFFERFKGFLDNPESVWKHAYETHITDFSKYLLVNLLTAGVSISSSDLHRLMMNFVEKKGAKYGLTFSDIDYAKTLRELENTFINITKDSRDEIGIDYQNPQIQDFLAHYFADKPNIIDDVMDCAIYFEQFVTILNYEGSESSSSMKVPLSAEMTRTMLDRLEKNFDDLESCAIEHMVWKSGRKTWYRTYGRIHKRLLRLMRDSVLSAHPAIRATVLKRFEESLEQMDEHLDVYECIRLIREFRKELSVKPDVLLETVWYGVRQLFQTKDFSTLETVFRKEYSAFVETEKFKSELYDLAKQELDDFDEDGYESILEEFDTAEENFDIGLGELKDELEAIESQAKQQADDVHDTQWESSTLSSRPILEMNERDAIRTLFTRFEGRS